MIEYILIIVFLVIIVFCFVVLHKSKVKSIKQGSEIQRLQRLQIESEERLQQLQAEKEKHVDQNEVLFKKYNKELSFRKSSEVRLGQIGENLAPFLRGWPWDSKQFRFLGNPVDGIQFTEDSIFFVEIKTGKSRLSSKQIHIKNLIKEGKVKFATFRIGEDGCTSKIED